MEELVFLLTASKATLLHRVECFVAACRYYEAEELERRFLKLQQDKRLQKEVAVHLGSMWAEMDEADRVTMRGRQVQQAFKALAVLKASRPKVRAEEAISAGEYEVVL